MTPTDIEDILARLSLREPTGSRLGTPVLDVQAPEYLRLVNAGTVAVSHLLSMLQAAPARRAAWIVAALGQIGDPRALPALRETCARWGELESPDEWDYAVRGQCRLALERLGSSGPDQVIGMAEE